MEHQIMKYEDYYEPDDPLFYFEQRESNLEGMVVGKWQFHYGSEQYMDRNDREVPEKQFKFLTRLLRQTEAYKKYPIITARSGL